MKIQKPDIAVLLTCHNRKEKTLRCLENLFLQKEAGTGFSMKVFLVDDGSTDGTGDAVRQRFPDVNIIMGNGQLFWNKGMHLAWKSAAAAGEFDYYLWVNDDVVMFPDALSVAVNCAGDIAEPAVICGATQSAITKEFTYGGLEKNGAKVIPDGQLKRCSVINGNFVLIPKTVFLKTGMNDPIFPHSIGDHDYGLRAIRDGFSVYSLPSYIGYCERNEKLPKWCQREVPFSQRLRSLYSPLGNSHPYYYFIYERRHFGILTAVKHFFTIHLRVLFPAIWS